MIGGRGVTQDFGVYDVGLYIEGKPTAGEIVWRFMAPRALTLRPNLAGSIATARVAPTASATFTLAQNGTTIASIVFGAGSSAATMPTTNAVQIAVSDLLTLTAPATQDATLSDVALSLVLLR